MKNQINNEEKIVDIERQIQELRNRVVSLERHFIRRRDVGITTSEPPAKEISIKEFLLQLKPKDDIQKTLAIGYFLEKYEGQNFFTAKDLLEGFRKCKEKPPANINDKVNKNIEKGYMMQATAKKDRLLAWTLTVSGERFIEETLNRITNESRGN